MTPLTKDLQREMIFQDGRTYVVKLRAATRPMIEFREKGRKESVSVLLESVYIFAVRGKMA
jgi:hypothetical protein